jgi:Rrf2 family protein
VRLALRTRYAICGIFDVAYNGQGEPVGTRAISGRQGIPARYLEQIFQRLRRAGLLTSRRGPGGGYLLARPAAEISLRQIVEAIEGPLADTLVPDSADSARTPYGPDFLWPALAAGVGGVLSRISLESLCRDAARSQVERAEPPAPMYFI